MSFAVKFAVMFRKQLELKRPSKLNWSQKERTTPASTQQMVGPTHRLLKLKSLIQELLPVNYWDFVELAVLSFKPHNIAEVKHSNTHRRHFPRRIFCVYRAISLWMCCGVYRRNLQQYLHAMRTVVHCNGVYIVSLPVPGDDNSSEIWLQIHVEV